MLLIGKGGGGLGLVDVVPKGRLNVANLSTHYVLCLCVLYRTGTIGGHGVVVGRSGRSPWLLLTAPLIVVIIVLSGRKKASTKDLDTSKKNT